jgi:hypothetical protein
MMLYTALSQDVPGKQKMVHYLMAATNSSTRKQQLLKLVRGVLRVKVGEKNEKGERASIGRGDSVRVYKFNPKEDVRGHSGIRTDGKLSGVPFKRELYTIKYPFPEGDETKHVPPGLYGTVLAVRHTPGKPKQVKVMMWFHQDGVFRLNDRTGVVEGQHAKNIQTPMKDDPENFLTFLHYTTWLLPSQVHRRGIKELKKHVIGLLEKAQEAAKQKAMEEPEEVEVEEEPFMEELQCRPPTDEEEDYSWGSARKEPEGEEQSCDETESDEEESDEEEEEKDEEVES